MDDDQTIAQLVAAERQRDRSASLAEQIRERRSGFFRVIEGASSGEAVQPPAGAGPTDGAA